MVIYDPIVSATITRTLAAPSNAEVVFDNIQGEFDPDNPNAPEWLKIEEPVSIAAMVYREEDSGDNIFLGLKKLFTGYIDTVETGGFTGSGQEQVTIRLLDKMAFLPILKFTSRIYQNEGIREILGEILNKVGIPVGFSPVGGYRPSEIQFVDETYQNAINLLLQADFSTGTIDAEGLFRVFQLATDATHRDLPDVIIEEVTPTYGREQPVTCIRVQITPTGESTKVGTEEIFGTFEGDILQSEGIKIINAYYSEDHKTLATDPVVEELEGSTNIGQISVINHGNYAEIRLVAVPNTTAHYNIQLKAKRIEEGDADYEVIFYDAELENKYGGRIEKKISNLVITDSQQALNIARNYLSLEHWKKIQYSISLNTFWDVLPGLVVIFKHPKYRYDVKVILDNVTHKYTPKKGLVTYLSGYKVGEFYV